MSSTPKIATSAKIVPHLWFVDQAVEAANFYVSLFPDSRVDSVTPIPADTPSGPAGSVQVIEAGKWSDIAESSASRRSQ